jgi:hypothetical protein
MVGEAGTGTTKTVRGEEWKGNLSELNPFHLSEALYRYATLGTSHVKLSVLTVRQTNLRKGAAQQPFPTGYCNNVHGDKGHWGTFEGKVTINDEKMTVEGTYKLAGGDGEYRGVTGSGKFTTMMKSETEIDCAWEGKYTLAKAKAHAR